MTFIGMAAHVASGRSRFAAMVGVIKINIK
jgi:hypothetical protein